MSKKVVSIEEGTGRTGALVPESGVYAVRHSEHRLPAEVTLLHGHRFPSCEACEEPVTYRLRRRLGHAVISSQFNVQLHHLPVLDRYAS